MGYFTSDIKLEDSMSQFPDSYNIRGYLASLVQLLFTFHETSIDLSSTNTKEASIFRYFTQNAFIIFLMQRSNIRSEKTVDIARKIIKNKRKLETKCQ